MKLIINIFFLLACSLLYADNDTIVADRPGFSTGVYTVKPGVYNIEAGYEHAFNHSDNNSKTQKLPLLNLRMGITPKSELYLLWDGWNRLEKDNQEAESSYSDFSVGGKYRLYESEQYDITMLGSVSLPSGSNSSTSDNIDPLLAVLWDIEITNKVSLFGMAQGSTFKSSDDHIYVIEPAMGFSFVHAEKWGSFIEYYSKIHSHSSFDSESIVDAGITYLLNNEVQLDVNTGIKLNDASENFVGIGVAMRFN